jgi:uncharacterized protein (DUF1800 family)
MIPGRGLGLVLLCTALGIAAIGCSAPARGQAAGGAGAHRDPSPAVVPAPLDDAAALHLLSRATFGPRPGDVERVRRLGAAAWLERELAPRREGDTMVDTALAPMKTLTMSIPALLREYPRPDPALREKIQSGQMTQRELMEMYPPEKRPGRIVAELQAAKMVRAVIAERQLEEVMVDFWFNHFNVFAPKAEVRWYVTAYERDAIRPHALGRFPDLVRATMRHPAMLYYLDNWLSARADFRLPAGPNRGRKAGLNENYARELLELHTLGVDGGYTQKDVTEVARAVDREARERPREDGRFVFRPVMHDRGEKVVLGHRIAAASGDSDGDRVIEIVTRHPSTARFIATKLVRRFVADDPAPALVDRVAATYRSTDGDIPAMLRTIFTAQEFWAADARRAKIKKPFEFVASAARAVSAQVDARGAFELARATGEIGEPLYEAQPPTGHPDRADAWVSTGALLARMNFALALAQNRYPGVRVDLTSVLGGTDGTRPAAVLDRLLAAVLHGGVTRETRAVLASQLGDRELTRLDRDDRGPARTDFEKIMALVLGSPEFQRR